MPNLKEKHDEIKKEAQKKNDSKIYYPMYSVHIPGDFNSVNPLLDHYDDAKKQANFSFQILKKLCKNEDDKYDQYYFPFNYSLKRERSMKQKAKRRKIKENVYFEEQMNIISRPKRYCEFNFYTNKKEQIKKVIRDKSLRLGQRNIGFGFIYFNDCYKKMLMEMFTSSFKDIKKELKNFLKN